MAQPYVGEIRMFGGNFAPAGWMLCDGSLVPISEYEVLFQLIGTTYGGDGESTYALPDLRGRAPVHYGQGPGISQNYVIGETFGVEEVTLTTQQIPSHTHALLASTAAGTASSPEGRVVAQPSDVRMFIRDSPSFALPADTVTQVGGSQPHSNRSPYLAVNYIISLFGIFPSPT